MKAELRVVVSFLFLIGFISCFGSNNETTNTNPDLEGSSVPFTDAYIEYLGPHEKWAGPQNFSVHVNTKGPEKAKVYISTSIFKGESSSERSLQSVSHGVTIDAAREQIARLSSAMQEKDPTIRGCLLPVRVKLIREDGVLMTRQGCRGQAGWPKVASEIVNQLVGSAMTVAKPEEASKSVQVRKKPLN
jgi:hypothetical protein